MTKNVFVFEISGASLVWSPEPSSPRAPGLHTFKGMRCWLNYLLSLTIFLAAPASQASFLERLKNFARPQNIDRSAAPKTISAAPECSEVFSSGIPRHLLFPYESRINQVEAGVDTFLAEGYSAQIFLALSSTDQKTLTVKKVYKQNAFGVKRFDLDVEGLQVLEASQKAGHHDNEGAAPFKVAQGERYFEPPIAQDELPRPAVRLRFVEGRTVHSLLTDKTISAEIKQSVSAKFTSKLHELKLLLEQSGGLKSEIVLVDGEVRYFFDGEIDSLKMMKGELKSGGPLLIKTDNIIVDPYDLNKMTIIDPY